MALLAWERRPRLSGGAELRNLEDGRLARLRIKVHENYCLQSRRAETPVLPPASNPAAG